MKTNKLDHLIEAPIYIVEADSLSVDPVIKRLAALISRPPSDDNAASDVIAIWGPWGSGKTSILNLLRVKLKDSFQWIDVDALKYQTHGSLLLPILQQMVKAAGNSTNNELRKSFWRCARALAVSTAGIALRMVSRDIGMKDVIEAFDATAQNTPIPPSAADELKTAFNKTALSLYEQFKKPLVVALDNLDRCRPDTALDVIESLQMLSDTPHLRFIIAADRDCLAGFINQRFDREWFNGYHYLEKIFPTYHYIQDTGISPGRKKGPGAELLDNLFNEVELVSSVKNRIRVVVGKTSVLRNPRRMKRFFRNLKTLKDSLQTQNINISDENLDYLMVSSVLKDLWPEIYRVALCGPDEEWKQIISKNVPVASECTEFLNVFEDTVLGNRSELYDKGIALLAAAGL